MSTAITDWKTLTTYEAKTTPQEKIYRVLNIALLGLALFGVYGYMTGSAGVISWIAIALATRKVAATIIGYIVYPAALYSFPMVKEQYKKIGRENIEHLGKHDFFVKKISIYKSGTKYDAVMMGRNKTLDNGKWTLYALGNGMAMESSIVDCALEASFTFSNTLLINGPSVCESGGYPTRYQMGAGFEAGIQLLENEVRATHIVMHGFSLGGGMLSEAVLNHDFKNKETRYLFISKCTFSRLSTLAGQITHLFVQFIFRLTNTELDGIAGAKKLSDLNIRQIIIQHTTPSTRRSDGVITDSGSLSYELRKGASLKNKIILESDRIQHNSLLPKDIENSVKEEVRQFFSNEDNPPVKTD